MDMSLSELWELVRTGEPGELQSMGSQSQTWLNWTEPNLLDGLRWKKEKTQITEIRKKSEIIINSIEIKKLIKEYYDQLYANKLDNLDEINKPAMTKAWRNRKHE